MFNAARSITYAANYDPYGQVMAQYLPNATPSFGFTGQMTDASGLQYLRARYYDPSLGAFLSQDPVQGMLGGASIRWNPYIYAGANPTNFIDPNGLTPLCPPGFVGQSCRQAFDSIATGFRAIFEGITAPARVTAETTQKASQKVYETSQTHWAGSAVAGLIDPVDIAVTLNNWANRDFFILDPLAFLPVLSVGALRGLFRHGDEVAQGAGRIGGEVSGILGRSDEFGGGTARISNNVVSPNADSYTTRLRGRTEASAFGTGTRQERVERLLEEAAAASDVDLKKYVDRVIYDSTADSPYFDVNWLGERQIVIDPSTLRKTEVGQLIVASHELVHAQKFEMLRRYKFSGDTFATIDDFLYGVPYGSPAYAFDEVVAETLARKRVARYLGGISPQQSGHSTRYINHWIKLRSNPRFP